MRAFAFDQRLSFQAVAPRTSRQKHRQRLLALAMLQSTQSNRRDAKIKRPIRLFYARDEIRIPVAKALITILRRQT